ncbi:TIR domain-containing protein [Schinkia azotoformans]|uniref:TIR domain-containing protein n=1 Tax=Schinkia azotoformans TaxID=1454 RepID=UPI002DBB6DDA|nr:TIR domain-containing protein [Schinkia azotoformans]MEC1717791.1 TIR domain-containing protein [Schinkia azotoformans]MEC1743577.1 TIR domain-containing protein [Schinkia azotoformans]MEC1746549.1 TIR domain-containing protein [Schinkia azotoformans]MEC1757807.1 TIR domain-containing protein [Schinkia azotoformans]MEC1769298.1 TIR domain-containing protein [Schinkia azotoformans]
MSNFSPPLSVIFVWHPADQNVVKPIFNHCYEMLSRDVSKPFSRSMSLPIYYRTSTKKSAPKRIEVLSNKTIVFIFIGKNLVADDQWINYIKSIPSENLKIIPIALDRIAFNLNMFNNINFIRAYDFDQNNIKEHLFISIAHEVYRYALNESLGKKQLGKETALKIFLSHAKDGKHGIKLAKSLKNFIDNTSMRNFFDATDIAAGYRFDDEIIRHIKKSTVIAIHTDSYSSRYWCQREILCAKEKNRPIIAVDSIEEFEDRRFPFASNIPSIHVQIDDEPSITDLLRILSLTILETIRFFYSKLLLEEYKKAELDGQTVEVLSRPPEISDIEKIILNDGHGITIKKNILLYPEPPVYSEELTFLTKLGFQISTPLNLEYHCLNGKNIGISISDPSDEELVDLGQSSSHLAQLSQDLARHLLGRKSTLIYGGDLREGGFTEFLFNEALALQARTQSKDIFINNYIAWPIYLNETSDFKLWKGKYLPIAKMIESLPPSDVEDLIPSIDSFLPPSNTQNMYVWSCSLTEMRKAMIGNCDIRICAGGKHSGYKGRMPGVLEEISIALDLNRPIFLLGGFGGVTASVCQLIQHQSIPEKLTVDWQKVNNAGYGEFLDFCSKRDPSYLVNYDSLVAKIRNGNLNNGLSEDENKRLFVTPFIDEAIYLVFKGITRIFS